jgi:hypothetical protein
MLYPSKASCQGILLLNEVLGCGRKIQKVVTAVLWLKNGQWKLFERKGRVAYSNFQLKASP